MLQGVGSRGAQPELRDATWPRWLAQAGIAVGIAVLSGFVLRENWMAFKLVFVLGCIWLALAGATIGAHEACGNPHLARARARTCRRLQLTLRDGTVHAALFHFK